MFGFSPFAAAPFAALGIVDVEVQLTGVQGTVQLESVIAGAAYPVTGVSSIGRVGAVSIQANAGIAVSGVVGTGQVGTVQPVNSVSVIGVSATGRVATVSVDADAIITEDSVVGTGVVGSVTVVAKAGVLVQGAQATGQIGQANVIANGKIIEDGVVGTGQIGTVLVRGAANFSITGVQGVGQIGTVRQQSGVRPTGVQATATLGTPFIAINMRVYPTGVSAIASPTSVLVWGQINDAQSPNWTVIPT
jgi:hypothetical protein